MFTSDPREFPPNAVRTLTTSRPQIIKNLQKQKADRTKEERNCGLWVEAKGWRCCHTLTHPVHVMRVLWSIISGSLPMTMMMMMMTAIQALFRWWWWWWRRWQGTHPYMTSPHTCRTLLLPNTPSCIAVTWLHSNTSIDLTHSSMTSADMSRPVLRKQQTHHYHCITDVTSRLASWHQWTSCTFDDVT